MEVDGKSLKEDSSFEILPLLDDSFDFNQDVECSMLGSNGSISIHEVKPVIVTTAQRLVEESDSGYDFCENLSDIVMGSSHTESVKQEDIAYSLDDISEIESEMESDSYATASEKQELVGEEDSSDQFRKVESQMTIDSSFISSVERNLAAEANFVNTFCESVSESLTGSSITTSTNQNYKDEAQFVNEFSEMDHRTNAAFASYLPSTIITLEDEFELEHQDSSESNGEQEAEENLDYAIVEMPLSFNHLTSFNRKVENSFATDSIPFGTQMKMEPSKELKTELSAAVATVHSMRSSNGDGIRISYQRILPNADVEKESLSGSSIGKPVILSEFRGVIREEERNSGSVQVISRKRRRSNNGICQAINTSLKFCKWIRRNQFIRSCIERAKISFNSFVNVFELEMDKIIGEVSPFQLMVIADEMHSTAIEEAFCKTFRGGISTSAIHLLWSCGPAMPVGVASGLQTAETKIQYARRYGFTPQNSVIVSVSPLLYKTVEQRWQMTTVICLDDPRLNLCLHNFTLSIPVPNEYVMEAERRTLDTYPFQESGFAINIEQAIDYLTNIEVKDTQEFLTGFCSRSSLRSAALVLAGMYQKYVTEYT